MPSRLLGWVSYICQQPRLIENGIRPGHGEGCTEQVADHARRTGGGVYGDGWAVGNVGLGNSFKVRDVWRQKDLGTVSGGLKAMVAWHGVALFRVTRQRHDA